jgi:hypothetical protein
MTAAEGDESARIQRAFLLAYGRPPREREVQLGLQFLAAARGQGQPEDALAAWQKYAQVLLSANEFAFVD